MAAVTTIERATDAFARLHDRRRQLLDWIQVEETSRESAHEWKAEVLKGRLQEVEYALGMLES